MDDELPSPTKERGREGGGGAYDLMIMTTVLFWCRAPAGGGR